MGKILVSIPDDVEERLRAHVPKGQISEFVSRQIRRALDESELRSLDDAIAHIAAHDKSLLDRLGNVQ